MEQGGNIIDAVQTNAGIYDVTVKMPNKDIHQFKSVRPDDIPGLTEVIKPRDIHEYLAQGGKVVETKKETTGYFVKIEMPDKSTFGLSNIPETTMDLLNREE